MNSEMNDVINCLFFYWYRYFEWHCIARLWRTNRLNRGTCFVLSALATMVPIRWYGLLVECGSAPELTRLSPYAVGAVGMAQLRNCDGYQLAAFLVGWVLYRALRYEDVSRTVQQQRALEAARYKEHTPVYDDDYQPRFH